MGTEDGFIEQQSQDFELIKRQYKHVTEIITYNNLLQRLTNIIEALEKKVDT